MRPTRIKNFMDQAEAVAQRSHDAETKVGSVLVRASNHSLVSTGFNGFIPGAPDDLLPNTRPEKYEYIIHSEVNLVSNCAKNGISTEGCYVVCTMSPCKSCVRMLVSSGIRKVICRELYKDISDCLEMKDVKVEVDTDSEGFFHITYSTVN